MAFNTVKWLALVILAGASLAARAQTLTLTSGVQKYGSLAGTTVTMSGKCELWVTNAAAPLSGCLINLNSVDAWLFLPEIKPSVVAATYLGQIRVNGAAAVADGNVRVVQYGQDGAIVIPQPATFAPLTTYGGAEFTGTVRQFGQWNYYTGGSLSTIRSFKLKRGYMAVLAQSVNGATASQCYIAQDGDLEVGVLPPTLDQQVQFIYVTPWHWVGKKGIAGDPGISRLNVNWWYNWNISSSSSRDLEYEAIQQQPYWPGLGQNWRSLGINTLLGYNEPDNPVEDAYKNLNPQGSVSDAVSHWPGLLATGLRIGSPAVTDGGRSSWLYPFVTQADAAGYRVDFIAIHYYQSHNPADAAGCASQMYNFLLDIWNHTHRPIWVTEWNNGANWTDGQWPAPTYAQQQACVQAMVNMLESTPFVERYALYNWVEDTRSLVNSSGTVTPAGTVYSNVVSQIGYQQTMPDNGTRGMAQYLFASNTWDTAGYYNNGLAVGAPAYTAGHDSQAQALALDGANSYVQLPANIARGSGFTFAAWVYWNGGANWQRIFDFGNDTSHYLFLTPSSGGGTLRFAINNGNGEQIVQRTAALAPGVWQHVAVTLNGGTATLYVNGAQVASATSFSIAPSDLAPMFNYLGKSQFAADPLFSGKLDDVEIADYAMSPAQISVLYNGAQNPFLTSGVWTNNADGDWSVSNNWSGGLVANGTGRMADFSSLNLTSDRTVTVDSARTVGGLRFGDTLGLQSWTVSGAGGLTLDGGGANVPLIAVNQNTAFISAPMNGANGFVKTGNGTLILSGTNTLGGGLLVEAGMVGVTNGTTTFGGGTSSVGYLTGTGNLVLTGGRLSLGGELRVGGSDQNGAQYNATGSVTLTNATLSVGSLTVARGNYLDNSISGSVTLNGGSTLISTNDAVLEFAGTGRGQLVINGGNFIVGPAATKWLMLGYWDSGAGELDLTNGSLLLENGSSLKMCRSGNTGGNVVNQTGGSVTFYSDAGVTVGGGGNLDLNYAGGSASSSIYNLNGGTLTVPKIIATSGSGTGTFNFNGGKLKPTASSSTFMQGLTAAKVLGAGAIIDTAGYAIAIAQPLLAGDGKGGGLTKLGSGTLTLDGTNTFTGPTFIRAGTLALSGGGTIANSSNISVAGDATLDVSAVAGGFTLGATQTLSGNGTVNGAVVNNGTLAPGTNDTVGTLTFNRSPVLHGAVSLKVDRNNGAPLNDQLNLPASGVTLGGTLTVVNIGPPLQAGDTFQLFSATSYDGNFVVTNLPVLNSGLAWSNSLAVNGRISVIATVSTAPTNIVASASGSGLKLSWPADHTGWRLQVQTNAPGAGLGTNWVDVPGSSQTNEVTLPVDGTDASVFYRLVYP